MKKVIYSFMTTAAVLMMFVACGKSGGGGDSSSPNGNGTTYATTPNQPCNIPGNTNCNPNIYQQYAPTFTTYQYGNANGFCGCPGGYRPVMNASWGISCAPDNWFPNSNYYAYNYNTVLYYTQNGQWTGIPQVAYSPASSGYNSTCSTAASVCDTRLTDPSTGRNSQCSSGGYCRASAGGSYIGLCTYGAGNETYSNSGNGCMRYTYYGWVNVCGGSGYGGYGYMGGGFYYGTGNNMGGGTYGGPR